MSTQPTPQPQQDWFAANAPPPVASSGDWFAQNAPKISPPAPPSASSRFGANFLSGLGVTSNEDAKTFFEHPITTLMGMAKGQGELAEKAKDAYQRGDYKSAVIHGLNYLVPLIGQQTDKAGEQLSQGDIAGGVGRTLGLGTSTVATDIAANPAARAAISDTASSAVNSVKNVTPKQAAQAVGGTTGAVAGHGTLSPVGAYYGAKTAGSVAEGVLGKERANAPIFSSKAKLTTTPEIEPPVPEAAPATTETTAAAPTSAAAAPAADVSPANVEKLLNDATGGKPLQPNVTLREQLAAKSKAADSLPQGFTPVKSTALKGYKYNAATREFESITSGGQHYIHGDVSPEDAQAFADAESKGKAWQQIRENPLVAKVVNGNRVAVKPIARSATPDAAAPKTLADLSSTSAAPKPKAAAAAASGGSGDLTSLLEQSLNNAKASKSGVSTSIDPATITKRWGVDEKSLADTREQTRGMNPKQYEEYIQKLTQRYKDGETPEPLLETRDADNNIISGDGRARAIAAQRAGVKRIPIIVRRSLGELK